MDTTASLLNYLYDLLTENEELEELIGLRVYPVFAPENTINPYIVLQLTFSESDTPTNNGLLIIHIWDKNPSAARTLEIKALIYALLDKSNIRTAEIVNCRVWYYSDGFIPDEPGIWHYVIQFNLRLCKSVELNAVIERDTS